MDFHRARGAYVVIDATEINRDWALSGIEFQLLRFLAREAGLRPIVPASVLIEAVANHGRRYAEATKSLKKVLAELKRLGSYRHVADEGATESDDYESLLRQRLESLWIEVADFPRTPHEEIVRRAVTRRPPFDASGSGYRDTLTWMTCMELAEQGETVFLVSQDKDFAGSDLRLAPELEGEAGLTTGSISLVRHLGKWLTPLMPWRGLTDPREAAAMVRDEEVAASLVPWDRFEAVHFSPQELGLPAETEVLGVEYHSSGDFERVNHQRLPGGGDRITYRCVINFEVTTAGLVPDDVSSLPPVAFRSNSTDGSMAAVIPMTVELVALHDERNTEDPLDYESLIFLGNDLSTAELSAEDPDQLLFPLDGHTPS